MFPAGTYRGAIAVGSGRFGFSAGAEEKPDQESRSEKETITTGRFIGPSSVYGYGLRKALEKYSLRIRGGEDSSRQERKTCRGGKGNIDDVETWNV